MINRKEIIRNLLSLGIVDVLGLLIPLVTMPILSRALGPEMYGQYLLLLTVITFGFTFVDYGIHYTGTRDVANCKNDKQAVKYKYESNQGVRFIFSFSYYILMLVYSYYFSNKELFEYYVYGGGLYIFGYFLMSSWFFQGISNVKWLLYVGVISKITNLLAIVFFVKDPTDINIVVYSLTLPIFLSGFLLFFVNYKKYSVKLFNLKDIGDSLRNGFDVFVGILSPNLYNAIPVMILGSISSPKEFAIFAVAMRLCSLVSMILNVLSKAIYPVISRSSEDHTRIILIANMIIVIPSVVFLICFGDILTELFLGKDYVGEVNYLFVISIGMIFSGIANAYGSGYLLPRANDKLYRNIVVKSSIISFFISLLAIYYFSLLGSAVSLTIARAILALFLYLEVKKCLR